MNNVVLMGRLTRDPVINYPTTNEGSAVARYTLAVDRPRRTNAKEGEPTADFISCVCFGKTAEFVANYLHQGTKVAVTGRIQTGSYTNKDGQKVYTTDVVVNTHEFAESRSSQGGNGGQPQQQQRPQQGGYNQPPQNQGYGQQGGYGGQPQQNLNPPDDFGFGGFDDSIPFN